MSVVINEYGIDSLILPSTSLLMRSLVLVYGTTGACISESNKWQNVQGNWLLMTIFNPPAIKIVYIVVFRDSKLSGLISMHKGRPWWWKYDGCLKRYSMVSTKLSGFTIIVNAVERPSNFLVQVLISYVEIKCQLDATDDFYCRSYCLLNMFRAPLCPSSGARECYTSGCCLSYLVLGFQVVGMVWSWGLCPVCGLLRYSSAVESSWNALAHGDAREEKWRGKWRMEWVASTLHTT